MGFYWNPPGAFGLAVALVAAGMAALVLFSRPDRPANRRAALLLALDAMLVGMGVGLLYVTTDQAVAYGAQAVAYLVAIVMVPADLFLVATLTTRLTRPLRHPVGTAALVAFAGLATVAYFAFQDRFFLGVEPAPYAQWEGIAGPWQYRFFILAVAAFVYSLIASVSAYRQATDPAERKRALAFTRAFGVRNVGYVLVVLGFWFDSQVLTALYFPQLVLLAYVALIAYGVLSTQMFDIDLRIKRNISRGTVIATFAGAFLLVSETVEALLPVDGLVPGILAAGAVALVLAPLRRAADRLADRLMPGVRDDEAYLDARKIEVYRAALMELARMDGGLGPEDDRRLARLRRELGLTDRDHALLAAVTPAPAAATPRGRSPRPR